MSDGRKKWENKVPGGKNSGDKCGAAKNMHLEMWIFFVIWSWIVFATWASSTKLISRQKKSGSNAKAFHIFRWIFFAISTFAIIFLLIGRLTTFNFNNDKNTPHLDKQDYEICIRREIGKK